MSYIHKLMNLQVFEDVIDYIGEMILTGDFKAHDKLPSVRSLANTLEVNPNTVKKAYDRMVIFGIVYPKSTLGMFVSEDAKKNILFDRRVRFVRDIMPAVLKEMEMIGFDNDVFNKQEELSKIYKRRNLIEL